MAILKDTIVNGKLQINKELQTDNIKIKNQSINLNSQNFKPLSGDIKNNLSSTDIVNSTQVMDYANYGREQTIAEILNSYYPVIDYNTTDGMTITNLDELKTKCNKAGINYTDLKAQLVVKHPKNHLRIGYRELTYTPGIDFENKTHGTNYKSFRHWSAWVDWNTNKLDSCSNSNTSYLGNKLHTIHLSKFDSRYNNDIDTNFHNYLFIGIRFAYGYLDHCDNKYSINGNNSLNTIAVGDGNTFKMADSYYYQHANII